MATRKQIMGWWLALVLLAPGAANAALIGVLPVTPGGTDYQAYYDSAADLTWLANANAGGQMNWSAANAWAAGLDINGVTGWRLPITTQPDSTCSNQTNPGGGYPLQGGGTGCTGSEMGNLFYNVLGGNANQDIGAVHNSNYSLFSNIQPWYYWSATAYAPIAGNAWAFYFHNGGQYAITELSSVHAWAVHSGDAGMSVPGPGTFALMVAALGALLGFARRKRRQYR